MRPISLFFFMVKIKVSESLHNQSKVIQLAEPMEIHGIDKDLGDRCLYFQKLKLGTCHKIYFITCEFIYMVNLIKI